MWNCKCNYLCAACGGRWRGRRACGLWALELSHGRSPSTSPTTSSRSKRRKDQLTLRPSDHPTGINQPRSYRLSAAPRGAPSHTQVRAGGSTRAYNNDYASALSVPRVCRQLSVENAHEGQEAHDAELARFVAQAWADGGVSGARRLAATTESACGGSGGHYRGHWLGAALFLAHPLAEASPTRAAVDCLRAVGTRHAWGLNHGMLKGMYISSVLSPKPGEDSAAYMRAAFAPDRVAEVLAEEGHSGGGGGGNATRLAVVDRAQTQAATEGAIEAARARLLAARAVTALGGGASYASQMRWLEVLVDGGVCRAQGDLLVDLVWTEDETTLRKQGLTRTALAALSLGNCLHEVGHLAWTAASQPDAPWHNATSTDASARLVKRLARLLGDLSPSISGGAASDGAPTTQQQQAYAACAEIAGWPPSEDVSCDHAQRSLASVAFCTHGATHQGTLDDGLWKEPGTPGLDFEEDLSGLPARNLSRDMQRPPPACVSPPAVRSVTFGCWEFWFMMGSRAMRWSMTRRYTWDDEKRGAVGAQERVETFLPLAAECARLATDRVTRGKHAARMGCYVGLGAVQTRTPASDTKGRYGALPCKRRYTGMASLIAASLGAEQAAMVAASRDSAPDFASVSSMWELAADKGRKHDNFRELAVLGNASAAEGGRDHFRGAVRAIVHGVVDRFTKYRTCANASDLCAPLATAPEAIELLGASVGRDAAALCFKILRRNVRYDVESPDLINYATGAPAPLMQRCWPQHPSG